VTSFRVASASSGEPGAGYRTSNSSCGKPPKSWIVRGAAIAVMCVPVVSQCAETTSTAVGVAISAPITLQTVLKSFSSMPFIGEPCPMKSAGIRSSDVFSSSVRLRNDVNDIPPPSAAIVVRDSFRFIAVPPL
jgi:hypothetical protein